MIIYTKPKILVRIMKDEIVLLRNCMEEHERVSWDGFQGTYSAEKVARNDSGESCVLNLYIS